MDNSLNLNPPAVVKDILIETEAQGFTMASEPLTGSLLRTLAGAKPGGHFLELGTGTGVSTAWLLAGMDQESRLISIEQDPAVANVAARWLGGDSRVTFYTEDAAEVLGRLATDRFDFIFADTWVGKFTHLTETLPLLKAGGLYLIDDMLPQANWPAGHAEKVAQLIATLEARRDLSLTKLNWASGIIIATKRASTE